MNRECQNYVVVEVEDKLLRCIADEAKGILHQNSRLESIFQKYNEAYNTTFKGRFAIKTLQVMNQYRKQIFSLITPSGVIRSPISSSVRGQKDATPLPRTAPSRSRISLGTERKRLSFDNIEKEDMQQPLVVLQASDSQQLATKSDHTGQTPTSSNVDEKESTNSFDIGGVSTESFGEAKTSDSPITYTAERFTLDGKPETLTSLSTYDPDTVCLLQETPEKHQIMFISDGNTTLIPLSYCIGGRSNSLFEVSPERFSPDRETKVSVSPTTLVQENSKTDRKSVIRFNIPIRKKDSCLQTETPDKDQNIATSDEKITPIRTASENKNKHLVISPSLSSGKEETKASDEPNTSKMMSYPDEKTEPHFNLFGQKELKSTATLFVACEESKSVLCSPYKSPEKCEKILTSVDGKQKTPIKPIASKRVFVETASNEQDSLSPIKISKSPNKPKVNKRKPVDVSEDHLLSTLVAKDEESVGPLKVAKLDVELAADNEKTIDAAGDEAMDYSDCFDSNNISSKESFFSVGDSVNNDRDSFNPRNSNVEEKVTIKPARDSTMEDEVSLNPDEHSTMEDEVSLNPDKHSTTEDEILINNDEHSTTEDEIPINNDEHSTTEDEIPINNDEDSVMDDKVSFNPDDSDRNEKCFNRAEDKSKMEDLSPFNPNIPNISANPAEEFDKTIHSEDCSEKLETQTCASQVAKCDEKRKKEVYFDISSSKNDQIKINTPPEKTNVEFLTGLMQNLSPSMKRSSDGAKKSVTGDVSYARHLCLKDNISQTDWLIPNVSFLTPENPYLPKVKKFFEILQQRHSYMMTYRQFFYDDKKDLQFVCAYLEKITLVTKSIPYDAILNIDLGGIVRDFLDKASKLQNKATWWESDVENDLVVWNDCFKKIENILQEITEACTEKVGDVAPKDFQTWETSFRATNKKIDDMILLRDIRRPTLLQFGQELEILIQLFLTCLFIKGIIKPVFKDSSD